jgi:hypothetical protein
VKSTCHPDTDLSSTAQRLRQACQAKRKFLDLWLDGQLSRDSRSLDRLAADIEVEKRTPPDRGWAVGGRMLFD